jgi:hypothetical protein
MPRTFASLLSLLLALSLSAAGHDISVAPNTPVQQHPVLAGNGSGFIAAWIEQQPSGTKAGRVSRDGEPLDGSGIAISEGGTYSVAIAHGISETLVVWSNSNGVFARRIGQSGTLLDAAPLLLTKSYGEVAVAWNAARYLAIWSSGAGIAGAFVSPDGTMTTKTLLPDDPFAIILAPDLAWDGRQFIVVFGAAVLRPCPILCPVPPPDTFKVLRVSADGVAIDPSPLTIPGTHLRAHVASSGAQSLLALDTFTDISTIVVGEEEGALKLGPEVPLAYWRWGVSSDVVWDGAAYTVGWRYRTFDESANWLAAAQVTALGVPLKMSFVNTGPRDPNGRVDASPYGSWGPSIAVNDLGEAAFAITEAAPSTQIPRARLYLAGELSPMPPPPPAPRNAIGYFGGNTAVVEWQSDRDGDRFLIEQSIDFGQTWRVVAITAPGAHQARLEAAIGNLFRISAVGPGGVSGSTVTSIGSMLRRRAQGH